VAEDDDDDADVPLAVVPLAVVPLAVVPLAVVPLAVVPVPLADVPVPLAVVPEAVVPEAEVDALGHKVQTSPIVLLSTPETARRLAGETPAPAMIERMYPLNWLKSSLVIGILA